MPKSKKPAGGRPNYEPRYGEKKTSFQDRKHRPADGPRGTAPAKAGSRSPGHRGHRPTEQDTAPSKGRWTAQERAGRDEARGIRSHAQGDRPARSFDERPSRSYGNDRPTRPTGDRPARSYSDRPARSYDDRPARSTSDRPARSNDSRPMRSYDDRPARTSGDRPARP